MALTLFNTLEYVKLLTHAGFSQIQAEGLNEAQMMATQAVLTQVATQNDMRLLRADMQVEFQSVRTEIQYLRNEMQVEFQNVRSEMQVEFQNVRNEMQVEFQNVRSEMQIEFQNVRTEISHFEHRLKNEIADLKTNMLRGMISMLFANVALMGLGVGALAVILT